MSEPLIVLARKYAGRDAGVHTGGLVSVDIPRGKRTINTCRFLRQSILIKSFADLTKAAVKRYQSKCQTSGALVAPDGLQDGLYFERPMSQGMCLSHLLPGLTCHLGQIRGKIQTIRLFPREDLIPLGIQPFDKYGSLTARKVTILDWKLAQSGARELKWCAL